MQKRRHFVKLLASVALPLSGVHSAIAQSGTIRIVLPLSPGTPSDSVTRLVAPGIGSTLGLPVVIDNKPGANGVIAVQELMRAPADGSVLLMGSVSVLAINMALLKSPPYDPRHDFAPVAGLFKGLHVWVSRPDFPATSMAKLLELAKMSPGRISVGHSSALMQIQIAALEKMAGVELLPVPYKSTSTANVDLVGGTLDLTLLDLGAAMAFAEKGLVRILGVNTRHRNALRPTWPAVSETVSDYDFASWTAFVAPKGLPPVSAKRIADALAKVQRTKSFVDSTALNGVESLVLGPDQLQEFIAAEVDKWTHFARLANIVQV